MIDMTERQALNGIYRELREIRKIMERQASMATGNMVCLPVYDMAAINKKMAEERNRMAQTMSQIATQKTATQDEK